MNKNEINPKIITVQQFVRDIEELVEKGKIDYIDAVLHYCEENEMEIETLASMVRNSSKLKSRIQLEAELVNLLPKTTKLPI